MLGGKRAGAVHPHQRGQREQEHVADQKPVDRLPHHHCVLADINEQQQHELAAEQHSRAGRGDDAERQRNIQHARKVSFEEVHDAERAEEGADAEPMPRPEQAGQHGEIHDRLGGHEERVAGRRRKLEQSGRCSFGHCQQSPEHAVNGVTRMPPNEGVTGRG